MSNQDRSAEVEAMIAEQDEKHEQGRTDREATDLLALIELREAGLGAPMQHLNTDQLKWFDLDDERVVLMFIDDVVVSEDPPMVIEAGTLFEREGDDLVILEPMPETATFTARRIRPDGSYHDWVYEDEDLAKAARARDN